jgi:porin
MRICRLLGPRALGLCSAILTMCCTFSVAQAPDSSAKERDEHTPSAVIANSVQNPKDDETPVRNSAADLYNPCKGGHVDVEALNVLGADSSFPPFADSITGADNPLRRGMLCHNFTYRAFMPPSFTINTLHIPVQKADQVYIGQRPTWSAAVGFYLIADLAEFHLPGFQLTLTSYGGRANWVWASPNTLKMAQVILYKPWLHNRLSFKAGYQDNDGEFIGMNVGGGMTSGSQGVYAVLPYEVGMSHMPITSPNLIVRAQPVGDFYLKAGAQRSSSPKGELDDLARDASGFRFIPKGYGLLSIFEGGYNRASREDAPEFWVRGGYLTNTTAFANNKTGTDTKGNKCEFILADRQMIQNDPVHPDHGVYLGVSAINVPAEMNDYSRYYEVRLYQNAPFGRRPSDMVSMVSSYSSYSYYTRERLIREGKTFATHAATITGSYSARIHAGTYIISGLSYDSRPAITPRLQGALTITVGGALFF